MSASRTFELLTLFRPGLRARFARASCLGIVLTTAVLGVRVSGLAQTEFTIDGRASHVVIHVGKSGMFGFAGHEHKVSAPSVDGTVTLDAADWARSSVSLTFDARALMVQTAGEPPEDVPKVQRTMLGDRVLDVERYPSVTFKSTRIVVRQPNASGADLQIEGTLALHGVAQAMTVPARATLSADGRLTARGEFDITQTDFGMTPVTAGLGTVRVKDKVHVEFVLEARR